MKNKKIICILMVAALMFSVAACGPRSNDSAADGDGDILPSSSFSPSPSPDPDSGDNPSASTDPQPDNSGSPSAAPNTNPGGIGDTPSPSGSPAPETGGDGPLQEPSETPDSETSAGGNGSGDSPAPSSSPDSNGSMNGSNGSDTPPPSETPDSGAVSGGDGDGGATAPSTSPDPGDSESGSDGGEAATPDITPDPAPDPGDSGGEGNNGSGLSGTPENVLAKVIEGLNNAGAEMPMSFPPASVAADASQNTIGLSEADFGKYVAAAAQSTAAIGTFAHQIIVIQGLDDSAAVQIKKLVSGSGGYDPQKWICVFPERVIAVESGNYVLIVASYRDVADTAVEVFRDIAGSIGEVATFWDFANE